MTNTELLIEAVCYAEETDSNWYEHFDSLSEAMTVLKKAKKEKPDDYQITCLIDKFGYDFATETPAYAYKLILKRLENSLSNIEEE